MRSYLANRKLSGPAAGMWAVLALAGGALPALATPVTKVDQSTTCLAGRSIEFCSAATGSLTAPGGDHMLPDSLADLGSVESITGFGRRDLTADRSMELNNSRDLFARQSVVPVIANPHMIASVQMSLNPSLDLSGTAMAQAVRTPTRPAGDVDHTRVELTLGTAMASQFDSELATARPLGRATTSYVSFALVNQFHVSTRPALPRLTDGEDGEGDEESHQEE